MDSNLIILLVIFVILILAIIGGAVWLIRRTLAGSDEAAETSEPPVASTSERQPTAKDTVKPASSETAPAETSPAPAKMPPPGSLNLPDDFDGQLDDKIRLLIVDDNPGTRDNVSRLLYFEKDLEVIGQAVNGRQGVDMAVELKPHIVLMDINMPDMDGITATREMGVHAPYSQVIIMSVQSDQHYMKRAMAAGARDFQPKPFTSEELVSCIRRVYQIGKPMYQQLEAVEQAKAAPQKTGTETSSKKAGATNAPLIAVYSAKGGVGTSAVAANLAVALHHQVGDVVLMDGDLQFGDVSVHLNTKPTRTVSDLIHESRLEVDLVHEVLLAHNSGLKLLLAPPDPQIAEIIAPQMIEEVIGSLRTQFKVVVVDTLHKLTDMTLNVLEMATHILVITTPELPAVKSTKLFLEIADQLEFDRKRIKVIVNRANMPGAANLAKIEKVLKLDHSRHIPDDPKLHFALNNRGLSIYQENPNSPSARSIVALAHDLVQEMDIPETQLELAQG